MNSTATTLIVGLAIMWFIQYVLTHWQMRRFYGRISELRKLGTVSIGMAGSAWKRRQYAVLVIGDDKKVVHAEELSGWTIFATLKPVDGLEGYTLDELCDDSVYLPISNNQKLLLAFRNAVEHIRDAEERAKAREQEAAEARETDVLVNT